MSDKNTEIAVNEGFAVLANQNILNEALADDCQGLEFSFDRVKLPAGGGTAFEIPSAEGKDSEMAKDITGVIVYNHPAYAYYHDKYTGGNNPPDCGSFDGVNGIENPGGNCQNCPYNKFGSGDGQSKLCKNKRMLYILREGELFPITISLPTGSLKSFTNYVKSQLSRGRKLNQVVTKITLKKATNASGIAFSQAAFGFVRMLSAEERAAVAGVTDDILKTVAKKHEFEYPEDKMIELSKRIKTVVDDKAKYTDWSTRDDIKANLQVDLILLLDEFGYPPVTIDDVYKEVLEQAENFKKYAN